MFMGTKQQFNDLYFRTHGLHSLHPAAAAVQHECRKLVTRHVLHKLHNQTPRD